MKILTTTVQKMVISDVPNVDPVAVYLEDQGPGMGKVTMTCCNDSWSYFWGSMGEGYDMRKFLLSCDEFYLAGKFSPQLPQTVNDFDRLVDHARKHICKERLEGNLNKDKARELYDDAEDLERLSEDRRSEGYGDLMYEIFGDEWWYSIPQQPNHRYEYLCRIINLVKEALANNMQALAA